MRAVYASCREASARERLRQSLAGYLASHGVDGADGEALQQTGATHILTYRRMVHNRIRKVVKARLPRVTARLGSRFVPQLTKFLAAHAIRTPYLRQVPDEFVAWAAPGWAADPDLPVYLEDLARHELLAAEVCDGSGGGELQTEVPVEPGRGVRMDGSVVLRTYAHAVHRLPKNPKDRTVPEAGLVQLMAYRDAGHEARYVELNELSGALMQALYRDHKTLGEAVQHVAAAVGGLDDRVLERIGVFLADLRERSVLLGGEPDVPPGGEPG
jgi:hypothetical protein